MKALKISEITPAAKARLVDIPVPKVKPGWVLIKVKAFGLNNSERLVRLEEIGHEWIAPSVVPGIECAGEIVDASDSSLGVGTRVIACMGGMGREFDGSYAEYALLPASHVFCVPETTPWNWLQLGAFPETYLTMWGSLFECLRLELGDTLLIRGAHCALGLAALQFARALHCPVIATARSNRGLELLKQAGASETLRDEGKLAGAVQASKVLDLIGAAKLNDTLKLVEHGGIVCTTGTLGGQEEISSFDPIKCIPNGVYLSGYFSNYPTQDLFDSMFAFMERHNLEPLYKHSFAFEDLPLALQCQEEGAGGKIVVRLA